MTRFDVTTLRAPIVQAPLAGGPSTPALAAAVAAGGGLGTLASGYKTAVALRADIAALRELSDAPFAVNLFVPRPGERGDPADVAAYAERIAAEAAGANVAVGEPRTDDDDYPAKVALLVEERPAAATFTFALPARDDVAALQAAGVAVWITVTTPEEAEEAVAVGADALIVQGAEAGGHRGALQDETPGDLGLLALLQLVRARTTLPLIATGGIATGAAVAAVLVAGAQAAQIGSALMLTPEAGTQPDHRAALATPGRTNVTRAFSGRSARGIVNRFHAAHTDAAPRAYPEVHHLTAPLRKTGDRDLMNLWAGQAHELARAEPAADVVRRLTAEARAALADPPSWVHVDRDG